MSGIKFGCYVKKFASLHSQMLKVECNEKNYFIFNGLLGGYSCTGTDGYYSGK